MPVVDGIAQPGIVEELYISSGEVLFRNYSVNNTLSLGLSSPVSVKWGVKDNHFFVQTGLGSSAIFYIYTLDRAAEGVIYGAGIIPTATLQKTLPIAGLNVTVSTLTVRQVTDSRITIVAHWDMDPPPEAITNFSAAQVGTPTSENITFILNAALIASPNSFGAATGLVSATPDYESATLDGDLNLLIPFQLEWKFGTPVTNYWRYATAAVAFSSQAVSGPDACHLVTTASTTTYSFRLREAHAIIVNLGANTLVYATLPAVTELDNSRSGTSYGGFKRTVYNDPPPPPITFLCQTLQGTLPNEIGSHILTTEQEMTLFPDSFSHLPSGGVAELVESGGAFTDGIVSGTTLEQDTTKRWNIYTTITPLIGRRSPGPLSGNILAAILKVQWIPTKEIAAWSTDVTKTGYFLLRGGGLGLETTLVAMQASAPTVTIMSANERYVLWNTNTPSKVYRTDLTTGTTVEVETDPTKFTGRTLTLVNSVYLYSQAETTDDEGSEGHFFVDIEATPLPTDGSGALVKWEMFNPVDDLKHL